ncbi:MAG: DegV family protein [Lachnospiraceae bacterium]|nr:DegV family protein [Lachnospiraceae bacterium]
MSIRIIVDSACDITQEEAKKWNLDILPLKTIFGDEEYLDGVTMSHTQFFEKLVETDVLPTTSQIAPYEYEEKFAEIVNNGDTAICITLSSKLSGCYQSANIAVEGYEDQIIVVDSENVCIGERILIQLADKLRKEGKTIQQIADILNQKKKDIRLIALLDTLEYLKKGGRISKTVAMAGKLLSIKPVIAVENGEVTILGKARGSKSGKNMLTEFVKKTGGIDFDCPYCLAYSGLSDKLLKKYVEDSENLYKGNAEEFPISTIGSTIGTHVGPGAIAAAFFVV